VARITLPEFGTAELHRPYRKIRARLVGEGRSYNEVVGREWLAAHPDMDPPDSVELYRRLLAESPDGSVIVIAVGMLSALAQLLDSGLDLITSMTGPELIRSKVSRLITMAQGAPPEGDEGFNWRMDPPAAAKVLSHWPSPVVVSPLGPGRAGARFVGAAPEDHPVARIYRIYAGHQAGNAAVWDHIAAAYAVTGLAGFVTESHGAYEVAVDPDSGHYTWTERDGAPVRGWLQSLGDEALSAHLEQLMIDSLRRR
jgi:inosine-uridine nucleoside N-ribohydrolase